MKNPNGYGTIKKLSGARRRPYVFVVSEAGKRRVIGFYETQVEALIAQTDYNIHNNHPRLSDNKMTFAELYHRWLPDHPLQLFSICANRILSGIQTLHNTVGYVPRRYTLSPPSGRYR